MKGVLIFGTFTFYILFYWCNWNYCLSKNLIVMNFHDPKETFSAFQMKLSMVVYLWWKYLFDLSRGVLISVSHCIIELLYHMVAIYYWWLYIVGVKVIFFSLICLWKNHRSVLCSTNAVRGYKGSITQVDWWPEAERRNLKLYQQRPSICGCQMLFSLKWVKVTSIALIQLGLSQLWRQNRIISSS